MIVRTLLDTDLYKFTTSYAYIKLFPYAMGTFSFNDRNETEYTEEFLEALKSEFSKLSRLRLTEEELEYMTRNCRFLPRAGCILKSAIFFIKSHCMKYRCSPSYPKSKTSFSAMYPI